MFSVNRWKKFRLVSFVDLLFILSLISVSTAWDNDDLELFDLVEETNYLNKTFYEVLDVPEDVGSAALRRAYHKLSLKLHPDHNKESNAEQQFRHLVAIYDILRDTEKRRKYDHILEVGLPDWRQAVFYYRKVRKFGVLELLVLMFIILTLGHYVVSWAVYLERRYILEQLLSSKLKKQERKRKNKLAPEDTLAKEMTDGINQLPKPRCQDLLPVVLVKGLFRLAVNLPFAYVIVRRALARCCSRAMLPPAPTDDSSEDDGQDQVRKSRRKRLFEIPEFHSECLLESVDEPISESAANPSVTSGGDVETAHQEFCQTAERTWSETDIATLTKAMSKIPSGTFGRWERIAEQLGRSVEDVTSTAKMLRSTAVTKHVSASLQGLTADKLQQVSILGQLDATVREGIELGDSSLNKLVAPQPSTDEHDVMSNSCKVTTETAKAESWSQLQQKALEAALVRFPRGTDERWEKISTCVPDKSKEECMVRFKILTELVKKKRLNAQQ